MPNRGNSHPWTKNHTATTITNISNSFILSSFISRFAAGGSFPGHPVIR
jgi:hypothetical protein